MTPSVAAPGDTNLSDATDAHSLRKSWLRLCMQDHKSLCVVVMICATLVNTQTHTENL